MPYTAPGYRRARRRPKPPRASIDSGIGGACAFKRRCSNRRVRARVVQRVVQAIAGGSPGSAPPVPVKRYTPEPVLSSGNPCPDRGHVYSSADHLGLGLRLYGIAERGQEGIVRASRVHLCVDQIILDRLPRSEVREIVLNLHFKIIQCGSEPGLSRRVCFEFVPQLEDFLSGVAANTDSDLLDGRTFAFGLELFSLAHFEIGDIAGQRLYQVVHQDDLEHASDIDGMLKMTMCKQRDQRHLPRMLGDTFASPVR